ncbi:gamma-glutamyl hydrolase isoform X2 [Rhinatrema bivittatum]|uniref:gamma-glutamyl hydrolase isoform X2 n=1 Tax=Rhinatrema bivittatum TaxID=194408 RepID=UPI00112A4D0A|nr:gamma-glutamyl hydrolase isoform X2 [Rhinatrema bivittatum]
MPAAFFWGDCERSGGHGRSMVGSAIVTALVLLSSQWLYSGVSARELNTRPIVGVLAQETHFHKLSQLGKSYIAASYVKNLEAAGARVVPIRLNLPDEEYEKTFYSINGVFLPGGGVDLRTSQYARIARIFYKLALQANDGGDYFPVWGTCLGFEQLSVLTSDELLLTVTNTEDIALPLNFTTPPEESKIFRNFPKDLLHALTLEPLTSNFHTWSLSMQNFTENKKLKNFYKVLTTNRDGQLEFISTMEARKNFHKFPSSEEELKALIYNYNPVYTGMFSTFEQMYFFD